MEREREQGSDRLDTEERKELNDSDFGLPEERKYPMPDATRTGGRILFSIRYRSAKAGISS